MTYSRVTVLSLLLIGVSLPICPAHSAEADLAPAIAQLRAVTNQDQPSGARSAWQSLAEAQIDQLTTILAGMKDATPIAENWLRSAGDAMVERQLQSGGKLPVEQLRAFILDTSQSPRARRTAYEWLAQTEPSTPEELLPKLLSDPSLDLRYDAVAQFLDRVGKLDDNAKKIKLLQQALDASRNIDQIKGIADQLAKLESPVDLTKQLGFITEWHTIGPFDIADGKGFSVAYPPETEIDLAAKYSGQEGEISWTELAADGELGQIDYIKMFDKNATGVMYAVAKVHSETDRPAEIRYESSNGTKVWLNGELVAENEVYHAGSAVDQYVAPVELKKGENTILVKVCQTKRTESWAWVWNLRLRLCDSLGGAIPLVSK